MHKGPDGLVYIMTHTSLYIYDQDSGLVVCMERFGIKKANSGDFWVFKNGDLSLRRYTEKNLRIDAQLETFSGRLKQAREDHTGPTEFCYVAAGQPIRAGPSVCDAFSKYRRVKVFVDEDQNGGVKHHRYPADYVFTI